MKWRDFWYLVALVALVCLGMSVVSCCPCRHLTAESDKISADSTYVVRHDTVHIVERETIALRPLMPSHDHIITRTQHSRLDNAYCISTAEVDEEGLLHHSLDTKDSALMPSRVVYRDRVVRDTVVRYRDRVESKVEVVKEKVTPWYDKPLRLLCVGLLAVVVLQNRKQIAKIIGLWRI